MSKTLKPRSMRDVGRLVSLIKTIALWNFEDKQMDLKRNITASDSDIKEAFKIWNNVSQIQESGIPPYVIQIFNEIIKPLGNRISRNDIIVNHFKVYGYPLSKKTLSDSVIPMLEIASFITQESDPEDKRKLMIHVS